MTMPRTISNLPIARATLNQLRDELRTIHDEAGDQPLNRAQQGKWNRVEAEARSLEADIAEAEEIEARKQRLAEERAKWGTLQVGGTDYRQNGTPPADVLRMGPGEVRDAARRILDDQRRSSAHLTAAQGDHVDALLRSTDKNVDGSWIARALLLSETDAYRSAWQRLLTEPYPVLTGQEADALRSYQSFRAMSVGSDAAGGYGVPALTDPTIILTDQQSGNPFWSIADVRTITTDTWKGVSSAGVSWSWDAEASVVSDDTPTLAQPIVPTFTARGFVPFSLEIGMDYPNFAKEMAVLLAEGYSELTAEAFVTGNGTTAPCGILTALDANTNVEVLVTTDGTFSATDIDKVWTALPDRAKANAHWLMSSDVNSYIALWGDAYGGRTVDLTGVPTTLRRRPIVESSYMPAFTGTTGAANILVVGNFRKFLIAQRAGMAVELVPHLFDTTTGRPTGSRGLFAFARVGSNSVDDASFRVIQNG